MASDLDLLIGKWTVKVKDWTWEYEFLRDPRAPSTGRVNWRDLNSFEKGSGSWAATPKLVNILWNGSKTRESWQRPLTARNDKTWYESSYFRGKYRIEKVGGATPTPGPGPTPPPVPKPTDLVWKFSLKLQADAGGIFSFRLELTDPDGNSENFLTSKKPVKFTNTLGTQVSCIQVGTLKFPNGVSLDDILGCLAGVGLNPGDRAGILTGSLIVSDADKKINSSATVNGTAPGQPKQGGNFFVASVLERLQF
jgi:hypothetical protein